MSTTSARLPDPDGVQIALPMATHDQVVVLTADGRTSVIELPTASDGPALVTMIAYVTAVPGTALADESVFVIDRSVMGTSVSTSVASLLPPIGSVTSAGAATDPTLVSVPTAALEVVTVTW